MRFQFVVFGIDCDWLATVTETVAVTAALCADFYCPVTVNVKMPFRKFDIVSVLRSSEPSKRHKLCRWIKMTTDIHSFFSFSFGVYFSRLVRTNRSLAVWFYTFLSYTFHIKMRSTFLLTLKRCRSFCSCALTLSPGHNTTKDWSLR